MWTRVTRQVGKEMAALIAREPKRFAAYMSSEHTREQFDKEPDIGVVALHFMAKSSCEKRPLDAAKLATKAAAKATLFALENLRRASAVLSRRSAPRSNARSRRATAAAWMQRCRPRSRTRSTRSRGTRRS
jgi:hypothetical protein